MLGMLMFILTVMAGMLCAITEPIPRVAVRGREPRAMTLASSAADDASWSVQTSGIDTNLRGVSAANSVDANGADHITVWASGSNGVILFSSDLGRTWKRLHVAEGGALDFRSIVAFDAKHAYVMSSGNGDKSRIYETKDGGETWKLEFAGKNPSLFLDALVCNSQCYALSDPVEAQIDPNLERSELSGSEHLRRPRAGIGAGRGVINRDHWRRVRARQAQPAQRRPSRRPLGVSGGV